MDDLGCATGGGAGICSLTSGGLTGKTSATGAGNANGFLTVCTSGVILFTSSFLNNSGLYLGANFSPKCSFRNSSDNGFPNSFALFATNFKALSLISATAFVIPFSGSPNWEERTELNLNLCAISFIPNIPIAPIKAISNGDISLLISVIPLPFNTLLMFCLDIEGKGIGVVAFSKT